MNLYAYVANDPVNNTDPSGMLECPSDAKDAGTCIDSSNYVEERDGRTTVQSNPSVDASAAQNMPNLATTGEDEDFAVFFQDGDEVTFRETEGQTVSTGSGLLGKMITPPDAVAAGHSHPDVNSRRPIAPSPTDRNHLDRGRPNYIYQEGNVIVLEQVNGQYQVRVISGSLSGS